LNSIVAVATIVITTGIVVFASHILVDSCPRRLRATIRWSNRPTVLRVRSMRWRRWCAGCWRRCTDS